MKFILSNYLQKIYHYVSHKKMYNYGIKKNCRILC